MFGWLGVGFGFGFGFGFGLGFGLTWSRACCAATLSAIESNVGGDRLGTYQGGKYGSSAEGGRYGTSLEGEYETPLPMRLGTTTVYSRVSRSLPG